MATLGGNQMFEVHRSGIQEFCFAWRKIAKLQIEVGFG